MNGGQIDQAFTQVGEEFIFFAETAVGTEPSQRALHDPAPGNDGKALLGIAAQGNIDRDLLERLRAPQMHQLEQLQREYPGLVVWDPFPLLCPGSVCSAYDNNGQPLFFDSHHLSGHGNRVLESSFVQLLLSIWSKPYVRFFASIHCDMY